MNVQPLSIGPILGYTHTSGTRIFGRARTTLKDARPGAEHAFAVARLRRKGGAWSVGPLYARQQPHFDFTGVIVVNGLQPDSEYEYQAGWLRAAGDLPDPTGGAQLAWDGIPTAAFRTASADVTAPRSFVFGSCRYLLRLFGGVLFEGRGDKTFRSIREQMPARPTHALLMLGDQIYADDLNFLKADEQVDEYLRRYRDAFGQPEIGALMARVPTYMTLDDHEIEDNWPANASPRDHQVKYPAAMHAYSIYQMSHSPLPELDETGTRLGSMPHWLWYTFSDGCCDFFVLDCRTERYRDEEIISQDQMRALKNWLADGRPTVKIVVSSVPIFPDFQDPDPDKWSGFIPQRDELLNFIHDQKIRRVITLSGDVHSSMATRMTAATGDMDFSVLSVVSSPLYWPYPHPVRTKFQLDGKLESRSPNGYALGAATRVVRTENFTRVTVDLTSARVEIFDRKGAPLESRVYRL